MSEREANAEPASNRSEGPDAASSAPHASNAAQPGAPSWQTWLAPLQTLQDGLFAFASRCWTAARRAALKVRVSGRRARGATALALAAAGPALALATFFALSSRGPEGSFWLNLFIVLDIIYLAIAIGLIARQIAKLISSRGEAAGGSKLHRRMVAFFAGIAAAPSIMVAVFFFLVIQLGFDAWFNTQVGSVVRNSRQVANSYLEEHRSAIASQAVALANQLNAAAARFLGGGVDSRFQAYLERATQNSTFSDIYILNSSGDIVARGADSFLFTFTRPSFSDLENAKSGSFLLTAEDRIANEMRGLVRLETLLDAYLYVSRPVDGEVLEAIDRTTQGVDFYENLEQGRNAWVARLASVYFGFVILVLLAAIYLGLWFAERLARPIGRLASAAERVRSGDLDVLVKEERGDDELALLSKAFNRMTTEVRRKQEALSVANAKSHERRMFSEAVLASVSAGVVALDAEGRISLMNHTAVRLLGLDAAAAAGSRLDQEAPEFAPLLSQAIDQGAGAAALEKPVRIVRDNVERELLARITRRRPAPTSDFVEDPAPGYVVTIDDMTELVQAQRMAAWGDVARRIAHEIKNPLTPIQLAAERLRRKFAERLGEDGEMFERYTDTIIRQTGDIGRMVDAFVRFAKMPSPQMASEKLDDILKEAVLLQSEARSHIAYHVDIDASAAGGFVRADRGQLTQAFTNLLQNAADAISGRQELEAADGARGPAPQIRVRLALGEDGRFATTISDNGKGLPDDTDRRRLLEPYVTTREKGAGLGLAIVSKIIEEHSGAFELRDADAFDDSGVVGASAVVRLPALRDGGASVAGETQGGGASAQRGGSGAELERTGETSSAR